MKTLYQLINPKRPFAPIHDTLLIMSVIIFLCIIALLVAQSFGVRSVGGQYSTRLAQSFIQGDLFLNDLPRFADGHLNTIDISWFNDKPYWPMGPFPSALLVPAVLIFSWLKINFYEIFIQYLITALVLFLIFKIAKKLNYAADSAWWFCFAFMFSVFLPIPAMSFHFPQLIVVVLLWASIWEYLTHKRYWLLGCLSAFALATRLSAGFIFVFFLLDILTNKAFSNKEKMKNAVRLLAPLAIIMILLGTYNFMRFNNVLETGYSHQVLFAETWRARSYGLINPIHVPGNLYYLFLQPPIPVFRDAVSHVLKYPYIKADWWGIGLFFTSPFLLYLFFFKYKNKVAKQLLLTAIIISVPIVLYYGIGYRQFGYRYSLDFLPVLFFLFMMLYREKNNELSVGLKIVMIISALINWHLLSTTGT